MISNSRIFDSKYMETLRKIFCNPSFWNHYHYSTPINPHPFLNSRRTLPINRTKRIVCDASVNPQAPLPSKLRIMRTKRNSDFFLLESEGLLDVTVKFSIADRKSLGIKNKNRQFSTFYKIGKLNLRTYFNNLLLNRYVINADPENSIGLARLKQTFEVSVDGINFEVTLRGREALDYLQGENTNSESYIRVLMYRIFERFNQLQIEASSTYRTPVQLNNENIINSRGLFAERTAQPMFSTMAITNPPILSENPLKQNDTDGRSARVNEPETEPELSQVSAPEERFTAFRILPLSLKVLQRANIILPQTEDLTGLASPTQSAGLVNAQGQPVPGASENLVRGQIASGQSNLRIDSLDNFFLNFNQFKYAFNEAVLPTQNQEGEAVSLHNVTILSRRTDFSTIKNPQNSQLMSSFRPNFIFSFFENHLQFDRVYVNPDYLVAGLEEELLQYVRFCHSKLIIYNTLRLTSYEKKLWGGPGETIAQKSPLKPIGSRDIPFRAAVAGTNPNMDVNIAANLMFTASFDSSLTTFYLCNRFITCSCFTDSQQISDPAMLQVWQTLEEAFGKTIIFHDVPLVQLKACFLRGPILECSDVVTLRGLVSNAGTVGPNTLGP